VDRREALFEAIAGACGCDWQNLTPRARGSLISAVRDIREAGGTADQVPNRAAAYAARFEHEKLTPRALAKWWPGLGDVSWT
jgi:hypothetical protein